MIEYIGEIAQTYIKAQKRVLSPGLFAQKGKRYERDEELEEMLIATGLFVKVNEEKPKKKVKQEKVVINEIKEEEN